MIWRIKTEGKDHIVGYKAGWKAVESWSMAT